MQTDLLVLEKNKQKRLMLISGFSVYDKKTINAH